MAHPYWVLLKSRWKWAVLYGLASLVGYAANGGRLESFLPWIVLTSCGCLALGNYLANDIHDRFQDRLSRKNRPLATREVTPRQAQNTQWILWLMGGSLAVGFGSKASVILMGLMLLMSFLYSLGSSTLLKTPLVACGMALCVLYGGSFIGPLSGTLGWAILVLVLIVSATSIVSDGVDWMEDRSAQRKTLPIVLGQNGAWRIVISCLGIADLLLWFVFGIILGLTGYLAVILWMLRDSRHPFIHRLLFPINWVASGSLILYYWTRKTP